MANQSINQFYYQARGP